MTNNIIQQFRSMSSLGARNPLHHNFTNSLMDLACGTLQLIHYAKSSFVKHNVNNVDIDYFFVDGRCL